MPRAIKPAARSCRECQKRKTRCSGTAPCSYCSRAKKNCVFEAPPSRTSLTRQNLDQAEQRCESLESLLRSLHPDLDIEAALRDGITQGENESVPINTSSGTLRDHSPALKGFEWREYPPSSKPGRARNVVEAGHGMASLPVASGTAGYLGSSSGSNLLEAVFDLLPGSGTPTAPSSPNNNQTRTTRRGVKRDLSPMVELESSNKLNTSVVTARLIDAYFSSYNTSYPVIHEASFRTEFQDLGSARPTFAGRLTYYIVLAIGHWLLSSDDGDDNSPYYHAARNSMSVRILESGSVETVQALILLGNYLQKRDRPNTGYNYIGLALRIALGLGLHRELQSSEASNDPLLRERRREVWWILYCMESGFSITTGRPSALSDGAMNVSMPCNSEDSPATCGNACPQTVDHPTSKSAIIAQAALAIIANRIYRSILTVSSKCEMIDVKHLLDLDVQLSTWKSSLAWYFFSPNVPPWFLVPRSIVLWKEQNIRIMLWRGSERSQFIADDKSLVATRFHEAATEAIHSIATFCETHASLIHQGVSWYATYFLFQATLALNIFHLRPRSGYDSLEGAMSWNTSLNRSKDCLRQLGRTNPAALRCLSVLDRIHTHFSRPSNRSAPASELQHLPITVGQSNQLAMNLESDWFTSADPSLLMFFDDLPMPTLLDGVSGFPGTHEQSSFDYTFGDVYDNRGATQFWHNHPS